MYETREVAPKIRDELVGGLVKVEPVANRTEKLPLVASTVAVLDRHPLNESVRGGVLGGERRCPGREGAGPINDGSVEIAQQQRHTCTVALRELAGWR